MEDGECHSGNVMKDDIIDKLFYVYAIAAFLSYYAIPCALLLLLLLRHGGSQDAQEEK